MFLHVFIIFNLYMITYTNAACTTLVNGNTYYFCTDLKTWDLAQNDCVTKGGNLVTISSSTENTWINNNRVSTSTNTDTWVGLKANDNINWVWRTSETGYKNWAPFTPDGIRTPNCARLVSADTRINDMTCSSTYKYICEILATTTQSTSISTSTTPSTSTTTPSTSTTTPSTSTTTSTTTSTPSTTTTSTSTATQNSIIENSKSTNNNTPIIIGVIFGIISCCIILLVLFLMKRKQRLIKSNHSSRDNLFYSNINYDINTNINTKENSHTPIYSEPEYNSYSQTEYLEPTVRSEYLEPVLQNNQNTYVIDKYEIPLINNSINYDMAKQETYGFINNDYELANNITYELAKNNSTYELAKDINGDGDGNYDNIIQQNFSYLDIDIDTH